MYTNTHSSVGAIILITAPLVVGVPIACVLAFGSHFVVDMFGEYGYTGSLRHTVVPELAFLYLLLMIAGVNGVFLLTILGAFFANLMDILDKFVFPYVIKKANILPGHKKHSFMIYKFKTEVGTVIAGCFMLLVFGIVGLFV